MCLLLSSSSVSRKLIKAGLCALRAQFATTLSQCVTAWVTLLPNGRDLCCGSFVGDVQSCSAWHMFVWHTADFMKELWVSWLCGVVLVDCGFRALSPQHRSCHHTNARAPMRTGIRYLQDTKGAQASYQRDTSKPGRCRVLC